MCSGCDVKCLNDHMLRDGTTAPGKRTASLTLCQFGKEVFTIYSYVSIVSKLVC